MSDAEEELKFLKEKELPAAGLELRETGDLGTVKVQLWVNVRAELLEIELAGAHRVIDFCFERFPEDPCATCREHTVTFRLARVVERWLVEQGSRVGRGRSFRERLTPGAGRNTFTPARGAPAGG